MRNLKKILALVLALVMTMSLVTVANAAHVDGKLDATDEEVTANYDEAVTVLMDMGIFQGYNGGESFQPKQNITRAEVATLMYRIVSKDLDDEQKGLYVDGAKFDDVASNHWAAGYIGYCFNGEIVKGKSATTFDPQGNVTGYEVLAMILRAIGYDKNGEFTGDSWATNVASTAQKIGILENVENTVQLSKPATRELVAELLFRTLATAKLVEYTPAFGYQEIVDNINKTDDNTLGWQNFYLQDTSYSDEWGRPGWKWTYTYANAATAKAYGEYTPFIFNPLAEYTTAKTECDVASDIGLRRDLSGVYMHVNGEQLAGTYTIQVADQIGKIGAQGRVTEVYYDEWNYEYHVVMVDTFLAEVVYVTPVVKDSAGHKITDAQLTLKVYDGTAGVDYKTLTVTKTSDWSYAIGQYLLVNAHNTAGNSIVNHGTVTELTSGNVLGEAESFTGRQTVIYQNANQHIVNGTTYNDDVTYTLDDAGYNVAEYTWFMDTNGNVIGSAKIAANYTYGVIKGIQWIPQQGANGYAQATIRLFDGTDKTVIVNEFCLTADTTAMYLTRAENNIGQRTNRKVSTEWSQNNDFIGTELYRVEDIGNGMANLVEVDNTTFVVGGGEVTSAKLTKGYYNTLSVAAYLDDSTKFLFGFNAKNVNTFTTTSYTGFNNIISLTGATVDYVDVNDDQRIDYVYAYGNAVGTSYAGLFYMTSSNVQYTIRNENGALVYTYELTGIVNGELGTIKLYDNKVGDNNGAEVVVNDMRTAYLDAKNEGSVLFAISVENGYVTSAKPMGNDSAGANLAQKLSDWSVNTSSAFNSCDWNKNYKDKEIIRYDLDDVKRGTQDYYAYYANNVLTFYSADNGYSFANQSVVEKYNIASATTLRTVISTEEQGLNSIVEAKLDEGKIFDGSWIFYVVYDNTDATNLNAVEVYAFKKWDGNGTGIPSYQTLTKFAETWTTTSGSEAITIERQVSNDNGMTYTKTATNAELTVTLTLVNHTTSGGNAVTSAMKMVSGADSVTFNLTGNTPFTAPTTGNWVTATVVVTNADGSTVWSGSFDKSSW